MSAPNRPPLDWLEARRLYEVDGLGVVEIARRLGTRHQTVTAHRDAEGWVHRTEIARKAHQSAVRAFVERQSEAVLENLTAKAELTRKVLVQAHAYVERLAEVELEPAEGLRALRDAASVLKTLEDVDASLLRDGVWHDTRSAQDRKLPEGWRTLVDALKGSGTYAELLGPKPKGGDATDEPEC